MQGNLGWLSTRFREMHVLCVSFVALEVTTNASFHCGTAHTVLRSRLTVVVYLCLLVADVI